MDEALKPIIIELERIEAGLLEVDHYLEQAIEEREAGEKGRFRRLVIEAIDFIPGGFSWSPAQFASEES